jgi:uncharacterized protein (UPF0332 family)
MAWQEYLEKARSNLRVAEMACDAGEDDPAVSRAYYAVFHAEIAALLKLTDFRPSRWDHDRVQAEFNRRLIHARKVFATALRFIHNNMIGRRHIADYEAEWLGQVVAERCVRKARDMVSVMAQRLEGESP